MPASASLRFNPRARLIRTIGDQLISGPEAAVIELVKNAHDADASFVRVKFEPPLEEEEGRITVEDDGHGMRLVDIQEKWMEPATTDKVERGTSPSGRPLLGSKGIGRFATAKLGHGLELKTTAFIDAKKKGPTQTTRVFGINWDVFETTKYLTDIEFPYEALPPEPNTGTCLTVTRLRDRWTQEGLDRLHEEMRRMISPLAATADETDFRIYLDLSACTDASCGFSGSAIVNGTLPAKEVEADPYRVRPYPILKACDYEVEGTFDEKGKFSGALTIHRGGLAPEKIDLDIPTESKVDEASCGTVLIHLFIFDRDEAALIQMANRAGFGSTSTREARQILDRVAGIAIYRDKFRIRPYGDNNQDWLTLDRRRVQNPTLCIGNNQVSGVVIVDTEQRSGLVERSSREGLEETASFRRLRRLITELLTKKVEPRRYEFRESAGLGRQRRDTLSDAQRTAQLKTISDFVAQLPEPTKSEGQKAVDDTSRRLTGYLESLNERLSLLEARVTLGMIIGEVLHEGRAPVLFIQTETGRLAKWLPGICEDTVDAKRHREDIPRILRGLFNSGDKLRSLFSALEPLSSARRGKVVTYSPNQVVLDTIHLLESRAEAAGVEIELSCPADVPDIVGYKEDLATALTNVVDNALHWAAQRGGKGAKISIHVRAEETLSVIDVFDNGPGVPSEFQNRIFNIGFTLKAGGTGLGLSIAREAISRSGGTIELLATNTGAGFRLSVPIKP